jgi:hypothetical protein
MCPRAALLFSVGFLYAARTCVHDSAGRCQVYLIQYYYDGIAHYHWWVVTKLGTRYLRVLNILTQVCGGRDNPARTVYDTSQGMVTCAHLMQ